MRTAGGAVQSVAPSLLVLRREAEPGSSGPGRQKSVNSLMYTNKVQWHVKEMNHSVTNTVCVIRR